MPELQQKTQKRQAAIKVRVRDIINGKYVKEEGWLPNYIAMQNGGKASRVNIIGTIVFKSNEENFNYKNFVIDDGSGKISVRSFEKEDNISKFDVGDAVLIIGRPREFNNEKYIIPEIAKSIQNPMWMEVRKLELELNKNFGAEMNDKNIKENEAVRNTIVPEEAEEVNANVKSDSDVIYDLIKKLDAGNGVQIEEVIEKSNSADAEKLINILLENGNIFEVKPGKVKVLE